MNNRVSKIENLYMQKINNTPKYKVLFVCLGNICRSPAAEGILKEISAKEGFGNKIDVDSAGTSGYHEGALPDHRMRRHGMQRGYNFCSRSRKFKSTDFDIYDIIIAMDDSNYDDILAQSPTAEDDKKVYRMSDFLQNHTIDHIPDPYYCGEEGFELVLDLLEDACSCLFQKLKNDLL